MILKKYFLIVLVLALVSACSTQKNTGITRTYHNLTSRYNVLFNGEESYKKGILKLEEGYDYDFSEMIPVFLYTDETQLASIAPEMDRAITKATKLISMHSLTVKPEYDTDKQLSAKQKEFLSLKEYNNYVDDAYLLMGKAHFYRREFARSKETFNYVVTNFREDYTVYAAKLWLARLAIEEERYREAIDMLTSLDRNIEFPEKIRGELHASLSDYYIQQEKYEEAANELKKAIEHTGQKLPKIRYHYILAQLYAHMGQGYQASEYYGKVIKMNPPYKMAFSAKIHRALSYQTGKGDSRDIEKQMAKMLRDDKNIDYQDQIYYALGNIYFKQNKTGKAIENYKLSLQASTGDNRQKAKTNLTLAELYYAKPDYINSQAYYDSAVSIIDINYPGYELIHIKSVSLTNLVKHINTKEFEDSVLSLSYKPRNEITALIGDLIEAERLAEEDQRRQQMELAEAMLESRDEIQSLTQSGSNFYFYNTTAKSLGSKEFIKIWGNRKLEDNWRRKNKSSVNLAALEQDNEETSEETVETAPGQLVTNRKSEAFYLQYIPFTDSAREVSNLRIANSLYKMGDIYSEDLKDYPKANESYEELLARYPLYEERLQVYYKLYTIARGQEDIERVSRYQQKIISDFPESNYARLMTNPNYVEEILAKQRQVYDDYAIAYNHFQSANHSHVINLSQQAMEKYPNHELFPNFDYMFTVSSGLQKDTLSFLKDLIAFENKYPSLELSGNARILIDYFQNKRPEVVIKQNLEMARTLYVNSPGEKHYFVFVLPKTLNFQQLSFNIQGFNLDNFDNLRLRIKKIELNNKQNLCVVEEFKNSDEAKEYLLRIAGDDHIFRDVDPQGIQPLTISQPNYQALVKSGNTEQYLLFYGENY